MINASLNKAALHQEAARLRRYRQYLPSLELKRQQLMMERAKAQSQLDETRRLIAARRQAVFDCLPMLAYREFDVGGLVQVASVDVAHERVVGVKIPKLEHLNLRIQSYSLHAKPHWVDRLVQCLQDVITLRVHEEIEQQRLDALQKAVRRIAQKVNLFDKVLIPRSQETIRRIRIHLSDAERADIVRAKITKQLRLERAS